MLDNSNLDAELDRVIKENKGKLKMPHDPFGKGPSPISPPGGNANLQNSPGFEPGGTHHQALPPVPEDSINPAHYRRHPSGIECIEVTRWMNFNIGNAVKYLWRYMDKVDPVENLKKAQWYIDDEIRRLEGKR